MHEERLFAEIMNMRSEMAQALMELIRIPAIAPENGGEGELDKAEKLAQILSHVGFDKIERFYAEDDRVASKKRPNLIAYLNGEATAEKLWIITHLDIVPPGEESLWTVTKPFEPVMKDGRIYGRGSEDNTQSAVSSIFAAKALKTLRIRPRRTLALCFVADEEQGSRYGIQFLTKHEIFKKNDMILVPDSGNADGSFIEIAEKSSLRFRIRTIGKQAHSSKPRDGLNANRVGMQFALALDKMLHKQFSVKDDYFDPPESTFEPTKKEKNVDALNIVPGEDINYFDCRILPTYNIEAVLKRIMGLAKEYERKTGANIRIEVLSKNAAPQPTDVNSKIVVSLRKAIKRVRHKEPKVGGIGGGTCAAFFRRIGVPAVVWATMDEVAHQPNEYAKVENLVDDAKIFAYLAMMPT